MSDTFGEDAIESRALASGAWVCLIALDLSLSAMYAAQRLLCRSPWEGRVGGSQLSTPSMLDLPIHD